MYFSLYLRFFTAVDHCFSNPCANNGTCHNSLHGYQCSCIDGFTGSDCEEGKTDGFDTNKNLAVASHIFAVKSSLAFFLFNLSTIVNIVLGGKWNNELKMPKSLSLGGILLKDTPTVGTNCR